MKSLSLKDVRDQIHAYASAPYRVAVNHYVEMNVLTLYEWVNGIDSFLNDGEKGGEYRIVPSRSFPNRYQVQVKVMERHGFLWLKKSARWAATGVRLPHGGYESMFKNNAIAWIEWQRELPEVVNP